MQLWDFLTRIWILGFDNWERALSQLGFSKHMEGKFFIFNEQLGRIIKIDETALCLDGIEGRCGGGPSAVFADTGHIK